MKLKNFEDSVHTSEDLHKKFNNTIVYAQPLPTDTPHPVYIKAVDGGIVIHSGLQEGGPLRNTSWHDFDLIACRPKTGIYNIVFKQSPKIIQRPVRVLRYPARQWRFGINSDNLLLISVTNMYYNVHTDIPLAAYKDMFEPQYPTFEEAISKLLNHQVKHIALNPKISIMLGKNRLLVFKNFVPFLAYKSGIPFVVNEIHSFVKDEYEKYANLLSNTIGFSKIK